MYCYCLSYSDHTYNSRNKQPKGTVIVLVILTTLTIALINNQCTVSVLVMPTTLTCLSKQPKGTVIVLVILTTLAIVLINKQKVLLLSSL
jgi:hypothetical protein